MYIPKPIDVADVELPEEISALAELLAENTHDVWAAGRIAEGWRYGEMRDDSKKTTPCLVPYADLPEGEKAYDRNTSLSALKLIIKLGYKVTKQK